MKSLHKKSLKNLKREWYRGVNLGLFQTQSTGKHKKLTGESDFSQIHTNGTDSVI